MTTLTRIYSAVSRLLILTIISALALPAQAAVDATANPTNIMDMPGGFPLITDASQFSSPYMREPDSTNDGGEFYMGSKLIDKTPKSYWRSYSGSIDGIYWKNFHYFIVDLRRNMKGKNLVFQWMFNGETGSKERINPTDITIYASKEKDGPWTKINTFDLDYERAPDTVGNQIKPSATPEKSDIYSVRHGAFIVNCDARYLKIEANKDLAWGENNRSFCVSEFQVYETLGKGPASALIFNKDQFKESVSCTQSNTSTEGNVGHLIDGLTLDPTKQKAGENKTYFQACYANPANDKQYLQVNLNGRLHPDESIQLVIRRRILSPTDETNVPIKLRVQVSETGAEDSYTDACELDFAYPANNVNSGLWQASDPFTCGKYTKYLRFYVADGSGGGTWRYRIGFDEFRLYKTNREDLIDEFYPNDPNLIDKIKTAQFEHTHGVIARQNHWSDILFDYCDWSKWSDDGKWTDEEDDATLEAYGLSMPDYSYISGPTNIEGTVVNIEGNRQKAHTVYHQIYAIPGEPVNLRSFSDIKNIKDVYSYMENFSRWYDFKTDKTSPHLYFPVDGDDAYMLEIDGKGHFAGKEFGLDRPVGTVATYFVPEGQEVTEEWIAVDYAQNFSLSNGRNFHCDKDKNILYEPRIGFRHIFHITDGRQFADDNMSSHEKNLAYAKANRRHITARADADFQIRIDQSPAMDDKTRSVYPYKKGSGYDYVRTNDIIVYDEKGLNEITDIKFEFEDTSKESIQFSYSYKGHEFYFNDKYYPEPTYFRALICKRENIRRGKYLVRLVGKDDSGNRILVDGEPLIVQEYMIEFVGSNAASFALEENIPTHHTNDYLKKHISEKPLAQVNFDNYRYLTPEAKLLNHPENYFSSTLYSEHHERMYPDCTDLQYGYSLKMDGDYRLKWPLSWNESNYSYMYASGFDFNMYTITNTFNLMPFNAGAREMYKSTNDEAHSYWDRRAIEDADATLPRGFMYYVNAASDPGEMVQIPIKNLCPGSTLYVTGWVCEQSGDGRYDYDPNDETKKDNITPEMANLIVSMQRIDSQGNEQTLHSFVTGYQTPGTRGQWHQFFYSVVLNYDEFGIKIDDNATFRIILENNSLSSHGADYAVDDIRVYVAKPNFTATQMVPLCDEVSATTVQVAVPFDVMLATFNKNEESNPADSKTYQFYYTFLKKDIFENTLAETHDYPTAFNAALLDCEYMEGLDGYGYVNFESCFTENDPAEEKILDDGSIIYQPGKDADRTKSYYYYDSSGVQWLVFNTDPQSKDMHAGDELIVAVYPQDGFPKKEDGTDFELCNVFDITTECKILCYVRLSSSAIVRINGDIVDPDAIEACENQTPVVTLDVKDKNQKLEYTQPFDWYDGPMNDKDGYVGYTSITKNGLALHEVMYQFRHAYRDATSLLGLTPKDGFTQEMLDWLLELTAIDSATKRPKVYINQTSFVFPPTKVPEGAKEAVLYVTGVPINRHEENSTKVVCIEPTEVRVVVKNHAPDLWHGFHPSVFSSEFDYPEEMTDVPLRIGLDQIDAVSVNNIEVQSFDKTLKLPLRWVYTVSSNATQFEKSDDDYLYLAETDDHDLMEGTEFEDLQLIRAGRIISMTAYNEKTEADQKANCINVVFDKNFTFREGCYYRFKFNYKEDNPDTDLDEDGKTYEVNCDGQHVFTIKVVPKYQVWTGEVNRNWANDDNWRRASSSDLLLKNKKGFENYITDGGANTMGRSYAPLDFTKVIIPYADGEGDDAVAVPAPLLFDESKNVSLRVTYDGKTYDMLDAPTYTDKENSQIATGEATEYINYDMAATELASGISCRPWYTHTVDEIHFAAHATINAQQYLTYDKAWAEFELAPYYWQLCSSPLKQTVAGDFYLPSAGARQNTPLFEDINFSTTDGYNRFDPAVFQRSWNHAGEATIWKIDNTHEDAAPEYDVEAVRTKWSNVYNDVKEKYYNGAGFTIKADLATVADEPEMALFRLPKADEVYQYFDYETGNPGATEGTLEARPNNYKLNDTHGEVTIEGRGNSIFFMAGNPFMCYMDVKAFIKANSDYLEPKYYFIDSFGAHHVLFEGEDDPEYDGLDNLDVPSMKAGLVPPFTSFFVELKPEKEASSFTYRYDESMMVDITEVYAAEPASRSAEDPSVRIEAWRGEKQHSGALLRYAADASADYVGSEDMALFCDDELDGGRVKVFTVAGKLASAINTVPEGTAVGLGLIAPDSDATTVRFSGEIPDGLFLYDAYAGSRSALTADTEFEVEGSSAGRYFITPEILTDDFDTFGVFVSANHVRVSAPGDGEMLVNVFDMLGRCIYTYNTDAPEHTFSLTQGMYLVDIRRDAKRHSEKIVIK